MVGFADGKAATAIMAVVMVVSYAFTPLLVERSGRRIMLNISAAGVLVCSLVLGACFYVHEGINGDGSGGGSSSCPANTTISPAIAAETARSNQLVSYVAVVATIGYMGAYSLGYGPLPWVILSELIPLRARATVGGIAIFLTWGLTFIVTKGTRVCCL